MALVNPVPLRSGFVATPMTNSSTNPFISSLTSGGLKPAAPTPAPAPAPARPAPAPIANSTSGRTSATGSTGSVSSGTATGSASNFNQPLYMQGIQQEYDAPIAAGQALIPFYQGQQEAQKTLVGTQYGNEVAGENNTFGANNNVYETQKGANVNQQNLSLAELADQIRGQNEALRAQLGSVGAGSSSAVGTGEYALGHEQNISRADVEQNTANNNAIIGANQDALLKQHNSNLAALGDWKNTQLNNIVSYYQPLIENVNAQIQQAQGEEKARLAIYGQSLTSAAQQDLTNLDKTIAAATHSATADLISKIPSLGKETAQAPPTPVTAPAVSPFNPTATVPTNATAPLAGGGVAAFRQNQ